jgi:hypothetical protein
VGSLNGQRVAIISNLVRADPDAPTEKALYARLLREVRQTLAEDEMPVFDAGFHIRELEETEIPRDTVRLAVNFTARRNILPESTGGRPPEYGQLVRPLARKWKGKVIPATPPVCRCARLYRGKWRM